MLFSRILTSPIQKALKTPHQVIIIYGPRQAGKTTLIKILQKQSKVKTQFFIGDDLYAQSLFGQPELAALKRIINPATSLLIIDEAQRIKNIGLTLKLLADNLPLTILASGSASFELANKINEPLTGRSKTFWLYPLSYQEIQKKYQPIAPATALAEILRFGLYPKVQILSGEQEKEDYLYEYVNNYLYKDILMFENVRKPKKIIDLLTLLALQIGREVSVAELAQNLALSQKAVSSYLDILEKMFVLINLRGFSRNLRKEIYKTSKYYFIDVGLRNALIRNFNPLNLRADSGELLENWFIIEKIKLANNSRQPANFYFWRTYDQKEIDLIEEKGGQLIAYECKWTKDKKIAAPRDWQNAYPQAHFQAVNSDNIFEYLQ